MVQLRAVEPGEVTNKIIVAVAGEDLMLDYVDYDLSFDSSEQEVLAVVAPIVREKYDVDIGSGGNSLYKTRKATNSQNIYVIPNSTAGNDDEQTTEMPSLHDQDRLALYHRITAGCMHIWSKGKVQEDRLRPVLAELAVLAQQDPYFLAHLTSYVHRKTDSKDLKVLTALASSLSDADGTPFSPGSKYKKPNLRVIGQAAFTMLDPKMATRTFELANRKMVFGTKPEATHCSKHLRAAAKKYIKYRETNIKSLEGIRKAGLKNSIIKLYKLSHTAPSKEASAVLAWKQKAGYPGAGVEGQKLFDFSGKSDMEIAQTVQAQKLSPLAVLGALPGKLSPVVAAAILEQCNGNQAVVLTEMFESQGLLHVPEVQKIYADKIATAKNSIDRVERIQATLTEQTERALKKAKADVRKEATRGLGKVFLHIDISSSMHQALEVAKGVAATLAECVDDPANNFKWGVFNDYGKMLRLPEAFEKDAFAAVLYGIRPSGMTDCLALWEESRTWGAEVDVFVTDQDHNAGSIRTKVAKFNHRPRCVLIIHVGRASSKLLNSMLEEKIPTSVVMPEALMNSSLVVQAVRSAVQGPTAILDEIMSTPLLRLPKWWEAVRA